MHTNRIARLKAPKAVALVARLVVVVGLLAAASVPMGCASKPTMKVQHAQVSGVGPMGIGLNVTIQVYNPNSFDVAVRRVRSQTTVANMYVLPPSDVSPNVWLPAKKTTFVTAPVIVPWSLVPGILTASMGAEEIPYHVTGSADVTATRAIGLEVNNQALDEQGMIPRQLMLSAARTMIPGAR